ncbi:hypothetical protein K6U06_07500 [Acidiferrimicrobium sp. IK]|uniref:hypothetical protein n=1 Tax=Acidiferrimicrobium sp. IK TaxID=2871700 RepID=UPI0021CB7418|nr:hypothetical protein [Acidiferrimicrobium sp. IK]MCU4184201.1 hypothetical protein [Acidiferrimicrobium sp. IK]
MIDLGNLPGEIGATFGPSSDLEVAPGDVAAFARATGAPVAPGDRSVPPFMLLALVNRFLPELVAVDGASRGVNYGTGPVRFPAPATVGDVIFATACLLDASDIEGGVQATIRVTEHCRGGDEPVCVADTISRYLR